MDLWNQINKNSFEPKDENDFSDYVKRHLDEDLKGRGIIVNREVQIHRIQRTDIHIDAIMREEREGIFQTISAIIEVKGCWHRDVKTALKNQLIDLYLKDNQCQHGLYLVGWFNSELWRDKDYRKKQVPDWDIEKAQEEFGKQAEEYSDELIDVRAYVIDTGMREVKTTGRKKRAGKE